MAVQEIRANVKAENPLHSLTTSAALTEGQTRPKEMAVIGLYCQFENRPALLVAFLANQVVAAFANLIHQHFSLAFGAPTW